MEFHEKLQELRKQRGMTQEELAAALYVSRTAVSKWESGRGYPSIDSLKAISGFFGVSLDQLLSSEAVLTLAEEDSKEQESRTRSLVFGALDCCTGMLLVLPLFGQRDREPIRQVSLLSLTGVAPYMKGAYLGILAALVLWGVLLFEALAVNYRPILIDGYLEASYPSSTTLLALCVIPTGMLLVLPLFGQRDREPIRQVSLLSLTGVAPYMKGAYLGILAALVLWGVLLSAGLVLLYQGLSGQSLTG